MAFWIVAQADSNVIPSASSLPDDETKKVLATEGAFEIRKSAGAAADLPVGAIAAAMAALAAEAVHPSSARRERDDVKEVPPSFMRRSVPSDCFLPFARRPRKTGRFASSHISPAPSTMQGPNK
ncbi:hypothetical protein JCM12141A_04470 [Mycolicibacterium hodleri]